MMQKLLSGLVLLAVGAGAGLLYVKTFPRAAGESAVAPTGHATPDACSDHGVPAADCPWCEPSLIESKGQCGGHGVPEALCSRCNASLIPGFKAVGDWCAGHDLPESQCARCKGGDLPPEETQSPPAQSAGADSAFCNRHQIAEAECPWCDASLIESKGQCGGHGVPEALCSRCNASLIPGFKAENDWCAGHGLPESQCARCKGRDLPPGPTSKSQ